MTAPTVGPFDVAGSTLVPARVRHAGPRAVMHVVPVLMSDGEPLRAALCGFTPKRPWVFRPSWPDRDCPLCAERTEAASTS